MEKPVIGMTGLGVMGKSMARNLMKAGFEVHGYARHPQKVQDLVSEGLVLEDSLADMAKAGDVIITMVGYPADVQEVYFGPNGILESAKEGSILVDMTTSDPELAKKIAQEAKAKGMKAMDAPVTGGDLGARNGTLAILAGGDQETFDELMPVFQAMGQNIRLMGENGKGQAAKLINQVLIAGAMAGVAEAWTLTEKLGMDPQEIYDALHTGAAASKSLDLYWPRMISDDMNPGFFVKHFIKDMKLAQNQADSVEAKLPVLDQVLDEYEALEEPDLGTQALIHYYEK